MILLIANNLLYYRKELEEMFKKILYPTDFSEVSKKAINYIKQLKEAGTQEVVVLHVLNEKGIEAMARYASGSFNELLQGVEKDAADEMTEIEALLKDSGFKVKLRIEIGIPLTDILKVEEEEGVSVIVIGSHGKSNVKEMLLGSVSEKVIRKSKNPVLVVKR
jgi:nucleotide-binding universal stress UspA family protein